MHPWSNWANNKSTPLPDDWAKTKRRLNYLKLRGCSWCSKKGYLELDHITPRAYGGSDEDWNLQWLCPACHRLKLSLDRKKYGREKR